MKLYGCVCLFALIGAINFAQAAEEISEIEVSVYGECNPGNKKETSEIVTDLPANGPYKLIGVKSEELSRNPRNSLPYDGSYSIKYLPSDTDVRKIIITTDTKEHPEVVRFIGVWGPRSWHHNRVTFTFSRTVPDAVAPSVVPVVAPVQAPAVVRRDLDILLRRFNENKAKYESNFRGKFSEMNTLLEHADTENQIRNAKETYSKFVCPILNELDMIWTSLPESESSLLNLQFSNYIKHIDNDNEANIRESVRMRMLFLEVRDEILAGPICNGSWHVNNGYYQILGTNDYYYFYDRQYKKVLNYSTMTALFAEYGVTSDKKITSAELARNIKGRYDRGLLRFNGIIMAETGGSRYKLYDDQYYCRVKDFSEDGLAQLNRFGGEKSIRTVDDAQSMLEGLTNKGICRG